MTNSAGTAERLKSIESYLADLAEDRREALCRLRQTIVENLPAGFEEVMTNIPSYVVPLSTFPAGYHCTPNTPLPFLSFASLKNHIALYHFGMYVDTDLMQWFQEEYSKRVTTKLDMGKSCVRFKRVEHIPFDLIGELVAKRSVDQWVAGYQQAMQR